LQRTLLWSWSAFQRPERRGVWIAREGLSRATLAFALYSIASFHYYAFASYAENPFSYTCSLFNFTIRVKSVHVVRMLRLI